MAVFTTVARRDDARRIARALVERGLVACAQISEIESFYAWGGALQQEPEFRLLLKTTAARYAAVEAVVREMHPYELPAIHAPRAGQKVLTLRGAMPREGTAGQPLCADIDGFSLHAAVRVEAHDRKRLEQLCRYITRPALSDERVQLSSAGQVELKLKTAWRDGTTHLVMTPLEFMQRLAALVPRPRLHLIRFHGVLAPNAKLRPVVVPQGPPAQAQAATEAAVPAECEVETVQARPHRISWARLLKRVFDIDMQHCPNCGSAEFKIIAAILERPVIEKILTHLGLDPQPPPKAPAREPGQGSPACVALVASTSTRAAPPNLPPIAPIRRARLSRPDLNQHRPLIYVSRLT
jgi:uncharacterized protein involved in tolerance to divalent cations